MDALMICLVAGALAAFGGRWFHLSRAMVAQIGPGMAAVAIFASAMMACIAAALLGGQVAVEVSGPGLLLFLALSLLLAGAAMLWPDRPPKARLIASARGPVSAFILLLAAMLGDSAPFIILATAGWTGATAFAMTGAMVGLGAVATVALHPALIPLSTAHIRLVRRVAGCAILLIGALAALSALGLL